jgi:hypothetical protein
VAELSASTFGLPAIAPSAASNSASVGPAGASQPVSSMRPNSAPSSPVSRGGDRSTGRARSTATRRNDKIAAAETGDGTGDMQG